MNKTIEQLKQAVVVAEVAEKLAGGEIGIGGIINELDKKDKERECKRQIETADDLTLQFRPALHSDGTKAPDLIDVIVQDFLSKSVLMPASMNKTAWEETMRTGKLVFYSRSRKCLWYKGKTSGDELTVKKVFVNCAQNALLILAERKKNGCCHVKDINGDTLPDCFYREVETNTGLLTYKNKPAVSTAIDFSGCSPHRWVHD